MAPKFLKAPEKCDPQRPTSSCTGRLSAVRAGELYWDYSRGGWVSIMNPLRSMRDWRTIWSAGQDTRGEPYIIDMCPFCGCELPALRPPRIVDSGGV